VLGEDGTIFSCGFGGYGCTGLGGAEMTNVFAKVDVPRVEKVSSKHHLSVVLTTEMEVFLFGAFRGNRTMTPMRVLKKEELVNHRIVSLECCSGMSEAFAFLTDLGEVFVFQFGLVKVDTPAPFTQISAGHGFLAGLSPGGIVWTCPFGEDWWKEGRLGWAKEELSARVLTVKNASLALSSSPAGDRGTGSAGGSGSGSGTGGDGRTDDDRDALLLDLHPSLAAKVPPVFRQVANLKSAAVRIACGNAHTMVLTDDGKVLVFGRNRDFQHARPKSTGPAAGDTEPSLVPILAGTVTSIWAGPHNCFAKIAPTRFFSDLEKTFAAGLYTDLEITAEDGSMVRVHRALVHAVTTPASALRALIEKEAGNLPVRFSSSLPLNALEGLFGALYSGSTAKVIIKIKN
jgi:hypothetical protein